jgi:histidine triad (HIT) family protein
MKYCVFCDRLNIEKEIIYETNNFIVIVGVGIITPGHIMIITKNHYRCYGELPKEYDEEFLEIKKKVINKVTEKFSNPFLVEMGAWGQSVKHAHIHVIPLEGKGYKINSIMDELVAHSGFEYEETNLENIRNIYKTRKGYVSIEENGKLNVCYVNMPCNPKEVARVGYREFFSKKGIGFKSWKTMNESDKKLDQINKKVTKEKLEG